MNKRILIAIAALLIFSLPIDAKYVLYSFSGDIEVKQGNNQIEPANGLELNASDQISIPAGAKAVIYNTVTKEMFTATEQGVKSVMGIMLDARKQSEQTMSTINDRMRFSAQGGQAGKSRLYSEGLVKRSMHVYDPEAENLIIDPDVLAIHIVAAMDKKASGDFPTALTHGRVGESGLEFKIENSLSFPIYVNVIKINETQLDSFEISELGQPMGCYVLLPGQTLARQQFSDLPSTDSHYLVMTHCRFDIDELISRINERLAKNAEGEPKAEPDEQLPVYISGL